MYESSNKKCLLNSSASIIKKYFLNKWVGLAPFFVKIFSKINLISFYAYGLSNSFGYLNLGQMLRQFLIKILSNLNF